MFWPANAHGIWQRPGGPRHWEYHVPVTLGIRLLRTVFYRTETNSECSMTWTTSASEGGRSMLDRIAVER
jgi:hypothetical protein